MPRYQESMILSYSSEQLFSLVADLESYPQFIPCCKAVHLRRSEPSLIVALVKVGFGPFMERFTCEVNLDRPHKVLARAIDGPLEYLITRWDFFASDVGTRIDFLVEFQFKSQVMDHLAEKMLSKNATLIIAAFKEQARSLYADKTVSLHAT